MRRQRSTRFRLGVLIGGIGLLALLFAQLGPGRILSLLSSLGVNFLVIVVLFGCHESVRALAVSRCLPSGQRPRFRRLLRIRFLGEAIGTLTRTGSFGAEPTRAWMLASHTGPGAHAYAAAVAELIANSGTSAFVTVVVAGIVLLRADIHGPLRVLCHVLWWSSLVYVSAAVVALAARIYLIGAVLRGIGALPLVGRRLKTDPVRVRAVEDAIIHALTDRPLALIQILFLELIAQSILVFEIYWTVGSMGYGMTFGKALFVEVSTKAANVIQFVGITEAAYAVVFNWLGMTAAVGFALSLVKLLRSLTAAAAGLTILAQIDRVRMTAADRAERLRRSLPPGRERPYAKTARSTTP